MWDAVPSDFTSLLLEPSFPGLDPWRRFLDGLAERGGPEESEDAAFHGWVATLADALRAGFVSALDVQLLLAHGGDATGSIRTMQGFVRVKPHGYAGDFELIDRIYQCWHSPDPNLRRWDRFFHAQPAIRAVRNAKDFLHAWLRRAEADRPGASRLSLLYLGGGPASDLAGYFGAEPSRIHCLYLDPDPGAIAYATRRCAGLGDRVRFWPANPLDLPNEMMPDLIWANGLFDYLDDNNIVSILQRLWRLLAPGGELAAANFSPDNPTRAYLELFGWTVIPRDATHLAALAARAGIPAAAIRVGREAEGVILFLQLCKARSG